MIEPLTPEEEATVRSEHYDWRSGGYCNHSITASDDGEATSAPFPCLPSRLLATLDAERDLTILLTVENESLRAALAKKKETK